MSSFSILKLQRKKPKSKNTILNEKIILTAASMENIHPLPSMMMKQQLATPLLNPQPVPMMPKPLHLALLPNPLPVAPSSNSISFPSFMNYKEIVTIEDEEDVNLKKKERENIGEQAEQMMQELASIQQDEIILSTFDDDDEINLSTFGEAFIQFSGNSSEPQTLIIPSSEPQTLIIPSSEPQSLIIPSSEPQSLIIPSSEPQSLIIPSSEPQTLIIPPASARALISSSPSTSSFSKMEESSSSISITTQHNSWEDVHLTFSDKEEIKKMLEINENKQRHSFLSTTPKYIRLQKCEAKLKIRIKQTHEELKKQLRKLNILNKMKIYEINTLTK